MSGFWSRLFGRPAGHGTAKSAKERLKFVLVHDRINLPAERMQAMKQELMAVISKYVAVTTEEFEIQLEQRDRNQNVMRAEIPFSTGVGIDPQKDEALEELRNPSALTGSLSHILDDDEFDDSLAETQLSDPTTEVTQPTDLNPDDPDSKND